MLIGFCFSAIISILSLKCFKLKYFEDFGIREYKTVAIETGVQNLVLPMMIVQLNFSCSAVLVEVVSVGLMFFFSQILAIFTVYGMNNWIKRIMDERKKKRDQEEVASENSIDYQTRVNTIRNQRITTVDSDGSDNGKSENGKSENIVSSSDNGYVSNTSSENAMNEIIKEEEKSKLLEGKEITNDDLV